MHMLLKHYQSIIKALNLLFVKYIDADMDGIDFSNETKIKRKGGKQSCEEKC